jgi:TPR repeat protein
VKQDFAAALSWYRQAAEAGNVHAMFNVGEMYDNGRGTPADRQQAIKWYGKAATRGDGRAAYDLGVIYRDGDGVPRDAAAAVRFFRMAADHGIAAARANLIALGAPAPPARPLASTAIAPRSGGLIHDLAAELGRFQQAALARDRVDPQAVKVFEAMLPTVFEQADQGDGMAEYDIGFAYEHGTGVPLDPVKAYLYYLRAATSLDDQVRNAALDAAAAIEQQLSDEEQGEARQNLVGNGR